MANQIQLLMYEGYLTADPDSRFMDSGTQVTNIRIGSNRQYKGKSGEPVKETTWLKAVAWNKLAEIIAQYCEKGSHVIVTGKLRPGKDGNPTVFEKKDGEHGSAFEVTISEIRILKGKDGDTPVSASAPVDEEDFPF